MCIRDSTIMLKLFARNDDVADILAYIAPGNFVKAKGVVTVCLLYTSAGVVDEVVTLSDVAKAITKNVGVK